MVRVTMIELHAQAHSHTVLCFMPSINCGAVWWACPLWLLRHCLGQYNDDSPRPRPPTLVLKYDLDDVTHVCAFLVWRREIISLVCLEDETRANKFESWRVMERTHMRQSGQPMGVTCFTERPLTPHTKRRPCIILADVEWACWNVL